MAAEGLPRFLRSQHSLRFLLPQACGKVSLEIATAMRDTSRNLFFLGLRNPVAG
jgi:hypothetical protein